MIQVTCGVGPYAHRNARSKVFEEANFKAEEEEYELCLRR